MIPTSPTLFRLDLFASILLIILSSCNHPADRRRTFHSADGLVTRRIFFPDSTVEAEETFKNDTLLHGFQRAFFPSGKLQLEVEFQDGAKRGIVRAFDENGKLLYDGTNYDGTSEIKFYYPSGNVKSLNNKMSDIGVGQQIDYSKSGGISRYFFRDKKGDCIYERTYDTLGRYLEKGKRLFVAHALTPQKDTIEAMVIGISPPSSTARLIVEEFNARQEIRKAAVIGSDQLLNSQFGLNYEYRGPISPDLWAIKFIYIVTDNVSLVTKVDEYWLMND